MGITDTSSFGQDAQAVKEAVGLAEAPAQVIPGDPGAIAEFGNQLETMSHAFGRAADTLSKLDNGSWTGQAADQFRENFLDQAPARWRTAQDAFSLAAGPVQEYAQTLATQQPRAEQADQRLTAARQEAQQHNAAVDAAEAAPGSSPPPSPDQAQRIEAQIRDARAALDDAKSQVNAAGDRAAQAVQQARDMAPDKPGALAQMRQIMQDVNNTAASGVGSFLGAAASSAWSSVTGLAGMVADPVNGPQQAAASTMSMFDSAQEQGVYKTAKQTVGVEGMINDPIRGAGSAAPGLIPLGGAGFAAGKIAGKAGGKLAPDGHHGPAAPTPEAPTPEAPSTPTDRGSGPAEWGRFPSPGEAPSTPSNSSPAVNDGPSPTDPPWHNEDAPFRPSQDPYSHTPDHHEPPSGRDPMGPDSRPEQADHPGPDAGPGADHPGRAPASWDNDPWPDDYGGDYGNPLSEHVTEHGQVPGEAPHSSSPADPPPSSTLSDRQLQGIDSQIARYEDDLARNGESMDKATRDHLQNQIEELTSDRRRIGG